MDLNVIVSIVCLVVGMAIGVFAFVMYTRTQNEKGRNSAEREAEKIVHRAKSHASKLEREAKQKSKDFESRARRNVENDIRQEKQKLENELQRLKDKEEKIQRDLQRREESFEIRNKELDQETERLTIAESRIQDTERKLKMQISDLEEKLQQVAQMTPDQAKKELSQAIEEETRQEIAGRLSQIENEIKTEFDKKAKRALAVAISRYASEVSTERTVATIPLRGDEMKGKIIGREGRNIRALESACGVDLIIDETPETVIISSFDPVRRYVAKRALERLIEDGRVHPARIEEVVEKVKQDISTDIQEEGEKACFELGIHGLHPNLVNLVGSLKYRQAEVQNLLAHSIEVAHLSGLMAEEIGFDAQIAKRAGLLHGIGRAIDHTFEGSYSRVGADFAKKHGEKPMICQAILAHAGDQPADSILDHILQGAFTLSRSRPGAKRASMESFVKRLKDLESVANSFDGVVRTYALQTGKEIRVMVDSGRVTDEQAGMLSRDVARKIEKELNYPGQIKVSVIRETRLVEHAR